MQDLLRYDDYNNDGHLTLQELYTAFRESYRTNEPLSPCGRSADFFCLPGTITSLSEALCTFAAKRAPDPLGQ